MPRGISVPGSCKGAVDYYPGGLVGDSPPVAGGVVASGVVPGAGLGVVDGDDGV